MTTSKAPKTTNRLDRLVQKVKRYLESREKQSGDLAALHPDLFGSEVAADTQNDEANGIDSRERTLLKILRACLLVGMGYFILGNVRPYVDIVDSLLFQWADTGLFAMLLKVPLIGWFLGGGIDLTKVAIGGILWAILQLLELLPTFLNNSPGFMLAALARMNGWKKLPIKRSESDIAKRLKVNYNAIPEKSIEDANLARACAYLLDGVICLLFYQPIEGGWEGLNTMMLTGDWSYIRWAQVGFIFTTLFAVEVLYWAYKLVTGIVELYFANN
jgi:hypothetical protein